MTTLGTMSSYHRLKATMFPPRREKRQGLQMRSHRISKTTFLYGLTLGNSVLCTQSANVRNLTHSSSKLPKRSPR